MSYNKVQQQEENTAKLVMTTFYKISKDDGTTASDITKYLRDKFGNVWRTVQLREKAEETLRRSAVLGFLEKHGDRYVADLSRKLCFGRRSRRLRRRRRRRSCGRRSGRKRMRRCGRRRSRKSYRCKK